MSESTTTGGVGNATSGADGTKTENSVDNNESSGGDQNYPAHFVDKLKKEKTNLAQALDKQKAEIESLRNELKSQTEQKLTEKEEYKTLWEREREERAKIQDQLNTMSGQIRQSRKRSAVRRELEKLGLNSKYADEAFKLVDLESVVVDSDTEAVIGAEEAAKSFYTQYSNLGFFAGQKPGVDQRAPQTDTVSTKTDLKKMSREELDAYIKSLN